MHNIWVAQQYQVFYFIRLILTAESLVAGVDTVDTSITYVDRRQTPVTVTAHPVQRTFYSHATSNDIIILPRLSRYPFTHLFRATRYLHTYWTDLNETYSAREWTLLKRFSKSEVVSKRVIAWA